MEISKQGIENIKDVRVDYEKKGKVFDKTFLDKIYAIMAQEEAFKNRLKVIYDKRGFGLTTYIEFDELHVVLKNLVKDCLSRALVWMKQFENTRIVEIQNMYAIYAVFHECTHLWQTFGCNNDPELNRLYDDLFRKTEDLTFYQTYLYHVKALRFSFERNATLEGFRETARVYEGSEYREVAEANYMFMIDDYGCGKSSPLDFTLDVLGMKDTYDLSKLSSFEKLEHGIMVDKETMHTAEEVSTLYAKEIITYDEGLSRLKKLK